MTINLSEAEEVLFRQVHPSFFEKGEPSSQPFSPTPKDNGKLSLDRSSIFTAQQSFELHTGMKNLASAGVYGLTVGEFGDQKLSCISDPIVAKDEEPENPAHVYADFTAHGTSAQKNIAKRLKRAALARGCLYKP